MIKTNTVLVLGAGASMPFGFPSGEQLIEDIKKFIDNANGQTRHILTIYSDEPRSSDHLNEFRESLSNSQLYSIDAFLEHRPQFMKIGKMVIAAILLPCEKRHSLFDGYQGRKPNGDNDPNWYRQLWNLLNIPLDKFHENQLSIITFNYDRSLEYYLYTTLMSTYGISSKEAAEKLKYIPIVHVHGQLGFLPWQEEYKESTIMYDSEKNYQEELPIVKASSFIKIIHEEITFEDEFHKAHKLLEGAENIYLLGFGYHKINIDRLKIKEISSGLKPQHKKRIRGTSLGISITQRRIANNCIYQSNISHRERLYDGTISDFLHSGEDIGR